MLVLITYDVETATREGAKRLRQVAKILLNYGHRVQNSVFECSITQAQFVAVKSQIANVINFDVDNIRFYHLGNNWHGKIESLGRSTALDFDGELII